MEGVGLGMIIGIGSTAQVGKDTSAQALCRDLGFRRIGFADSLKEVAMIADPLITGNSTTNVSIGSGHLARMVKSVGGWDAAKSMFPEVRGFLQRLGEAGRAVFGEDFWLDQVMSGIKPNEKVVISDVRYGNEFDKIRAAGGYLIRIERPGSPQYGHGSESGLAGLDWDAVVPNTGSVLDLEQRVVELVRQVLRRQSKRAEQLEML